LIAFMKRVYAAPQSAGYAEYYARRSVETPLPGKIEAGKSKVDSDRR